MQFNSLEYQGYEKSILPFLIAPSDQKQKSFKLNLYFVSFQSTKNYNRVILPGIPLTPQQWGPKNFAWLDPHKCHWFTPCVTMCNSIQRIYLIQ